jgi:hypothetical protein
LWCVLRCLLVKNESKHTVKKGEFVIGVNPVLVRLAIVSKVRGVILKVSIDMI